MSVKALKPITPGQRGRVVNGFDAITTDSLKKAYLLQKNVLVVEIVRVK